MCDTSIPQVNEDLLGAIADGPVLDFDKILQGIRSVRSSSRVLAGGKTLQEEIEGLHNIIKNLKVGTSISCQEFKKLTPICKQMLKKCENTFTVNYIEQAATPQKGNKGIATKGIKKELRGSEAVLHVFKTIAERMENDPTSLDLSDVRPLKQFRYVLTEPQWCKVKDWIQKITANRCQGLKLAKDCSPLTAGAAASSSSKELATVSGPKKGAASSATALAKLDAAIKSSPFNSKKCQQQAKEAERKNANIMRFFKSK